MKRRFDAVRHRPVRRVPAYEDHTAGSGTLTTPATEALDRAIRPLGASALDGDVPDAIWRRALVGPARESLSRPGKALRTTIVQAGWILGGGAPDAMPAGLPLVIEILHAGSLIVDDVEDGSTERRGQATLHRLVGVPLAINTGSWMYFWALGELAQLGLPPEIELAAHRAAATTLVRCHQGQALDLSTRVGNLAAHDVPAVVAATTRLKTGMLCRFAAELGALAAGASAETRARVAEIGEQTGIALQMLDDLGSLIAPARRDKGREDLRDGRPTWPWAWLAERDPQTFDQLVDVDDIDTVADVLVAKIGEHGRGRICAALDAVISAIGDGPATGKIVAELRRMEKHYGC